MKTNLDQGLIEGISSFQCVLFMEILILPAVVKAVDLNIDGIDQCTYVSQHPF